jgi:fatty-acyl-CoA synthase
VTDTPPAAPPPKTGRRAELVSLRGRAAWVAAAAAVIGIAAASCAVIGVRQGWLTYGLGRGLVFDFLAPGFALLAVSLGLITLVLGMVITPRAALRRSVFAVALGALVVWGVARINTERRDAPPVHEVSTDWRDPVMPTPGLVAARGEDANALEAAPQIPEGPPGVLGRLVAEINARTCASAVPLTLMEPPTAAYAKAKAALLQAQMAIVTDTPALPPGQPDGRLEATAARGLFARKDDVMVRVRPEGAGSRIDIRASARHGAVDGGENCKRLTRLRAAMQG